MITADILQAYQNGQRLMRSFSKGPSQTTLQGIWFDLSMSSGNPQAQYYFAPPQIAFPLARSTDGGLDHGDNKVGYNKYLHKMDLQTVGAVAPLQLELLDYLMYYPGIAMDAGSYPLTTNIAVPRYPSDQNIQMMVIEQFPYVGGATFRITYTNSKGVAGQQTPVITCNNQVVSGTVASSALSTLGASGRFIPLARGDSGVLYPTQVDIINPDVGLLAIVLVKPLASFQILENTSPCLFDLWNDFSMLPVIKDDAYLNFICQANASLAGTQIIGNIHTFWSNK